MTAQLVRADTGFHLWSQSYHQIPTIGPLFLLQGIAGLVIAVAVAVARRFVVLVGAALFALGTVVIRNGDVATFAAFGSFAMLLFGLLTGVTGLIALGYRLTGRTGNRSEPQPTRS